MKKKGVSLIELIIALGVMSIFIASTIIVSSFIINTKNKVDVDYCNTSIINFINNSREYCRGRNVSGEIVASNNKVCLGVGNQTRDTFYFPKGFKMKKGSLITVDNQGFIGNDYVIEYYDRKGNKFKITITVGNRHVQIETKK